MVNMLFYGCWLFAKPINDDVFPEPDEFVCSGSCVGSVGSVGIMEMHASRMFLCMR
jgi:hypothetical protein